MILGMTIEEKIRESMLGWLQRDHPELEAVEVTTWEEDGLGPYYGCETCGPDPITVTVYYTNAKGEDYRRHVFYGYLNELIVLITRSEQRA